MRLSALRALIAATADEIEAIVVSGGRVSRSVRADARLAAARTVHECRAIIADLLEAAGASAHFLSSPLQRAKRDVDIAAGMWCSTTTRAESWPGRWRLARRSHPSP